MFLQFSVSKAVPRGSYVAQTYVTDNDAGYNSYIIYHIRDETGTFQINRLNGKITTLKLLDSDVYFFQVLAIDQGSRPMNGTVNVTVTTLGTGSNFNRPRFLTGFYNFTTMENAPFNSYVGRAEAEYEGEEPLSYQIFSTDPVPFRIHSSSGDMFTTQILDREWQANYTFRVKVVAREGSAEVVVGVNVLDLNDNAPVFQRLLYRVMWF